MINRTHEALEQLVLKLESLEKKMFDCDRTPNRYARMCGSIAAELGAIAVTSEQCPSGWKMIPIKLDHEMTMAGYEVACKYKVFENSAFNLVEEIFYAILIAAPAQPIEPAATLPQGEQCPSGWQLIPIEATPEMEAVYRNDKGAYETAADLHAALLKAVGGRSNGGH